jgi:prepilin-type processing-associated H-X9-DG protein
MTVLTNHFDPALGHSAHVAQTVISTLAGSFLVMKKHLTCTYLFADGHAVELYEKTDKDCGRVQFAEITQRWTKARCNFTGRLIFGRFRTGIAHLAKTAYSIQATTPSITHGSDNTRKLGIPVGYLEIAVKPGCSVSFYDMPSCISGEYTYQAGDNYGETFDPSLTSWSGIPVARIHLAKNTVQAGGAL